ncbi:MAG TPA: DUF1579 family protein [Planctomycetaceae bacterium]|nr:DUF1579 family protein [Planctomycetaceae bacterium]
MSNSRSRWLIAAVALVWPLWCCADDVKPGSEELKRLDRYVGKWEGTVKETDLTSTSEMSWILGGTVLQQKYKYSDGATGLILRGYDKETGQYFFTLMDSREIVLLLSNGSWDAATKTFKFDGYRGSENVTLRSTFPDNDTENWAFTITKTGGEVTELRGTNKRSK